MSVLLQVKHLHIEVKKDKRTVVEDVSFTLEEREALVLLGQSGSGKTMSCHAIMGLLDPKRFQVDGEILFEGKNILMPDKKEKRRLYGSAVVMVPQNPMSAFDPSMRIEKQMEETLALHSVIKGRALHQRVREALLQAGLSDPEMICKSYPHTLSGGMLQRCLIAMTKNCFLSLTAPGMKHVCRKFIRKFLERLQRSPFWCPSLIRESSQYGTAAKLNPMTLMRTAFMSMCQDSI